MMDHLMISKKIPPPEIGMGNLHASVLSSRQTAIRLYDASGGDLNIVKKSE